MYTPKKQDADNVRQQVETLNAWDKGKRQAKTKAEKAYVRKGVYMYKFKCQPLMANVTCNIASCDFYMLAVCGKHQSKGLYC